jgi:hypothetical protein
MKYASFPQGRCFQFPEHPRTPHRYVALVDLKVAPQRRQQGPGSLGFGVCGDVGWFPVYLMVAILWLFSYGIMIVSASKSSFLVLLVDLPFVWIVGDW